MSAPPPSPVLTPPTNLFPLVRQLSYRLSPWLARTPLSPNAITLVSTLLGLGGAAAFAAGEHRLDLLGAALLVGGYVLDNCDGEVARLKGLSSAFGMQLDNAGDGIVHAALFLGLGVGAGGGVWLWLGLAAAAGTALNTVLAMRRAARRPFDPGAPDGHAAPRRGAADHLLFAFRELTRADFCFIVLALAALDLAWLLVPAGAIGAQVYWITGLLPDVKRYQL